MHLVVALLLSTAPAPDATAELTPLLGIPYVNDEVLDERGRWTYFARQEETAPGPGLNCSGFVVSATRRLLRDSRTLDESKRDRLGDSGPDAGLGEDWDFGWDLVMNLSEGHPRRVVLPEGVEDVDSQDARTKRGFPVDDPVAWKKVLPRLRRGVVYLASLSRKAKRLEHHHVALLLKDASGRVWFYQTLPKGRSHRLDLTSPKGFERMQGMFGAAVKVLLVEVELAAAADAGTRAP